MNKKHKIRFRRFLSKHLSLFFLGCRRRRLCHFRARVGGAAVGTRDCEEMPPKKKSSHVARMAQQMEKRKSGNNAHGIREASLIDTSGDGRVDALSGMATTVFTVESLNLKSTNVGNYKKKGKGKGGTYKRAATTVLAGEATYDVERRVRDARRALFSPPVAFSEMRVDAFDLTRQAVTLMPARPKWDYELNSGRLHSRERKAFVRWIASVKKRLIDSGKGFAPAFEQNIEVWRQLWRVLERADVAVLVVDARHPLLHTPPALYAHVARRLKKPLVLVLNKVDAIPRRAAEAWAEHLLAALPGVDAVVGFTSKDGGGGAGGQRLTKNTIGVPDQVSRSGNFDAVSARERLARKESALLLASDDDESAEGSSSEYDSETEHEGDGESAQKNDRVGTFRVGHVALLQVCRELAKTGKRNVTGSSGEKQEEAATAAEDAAEELEAKAALRENNVREDDNESAGAGAGGTQHYDDFGDDDDDVDDAAAAALQAEAEEAARAKDGRVMIGLVGHPNVGKSSMVNYILGRKAVSVKATPGHTKTLQTLILDDHTCLCDSPGLVFPRIDVSLAEQIVGGLVPLPVVREPYSATRWLAELRDATADRWRAVVNRDGSGSSVLGVSSSVGTCSGRDKLLADALATSLAVSLKIPPEKEFDPEVLQLTRGDEDLLGEQIPWSPMSLCRAYGKMRGFTRGGNPDTHVAGVTILGLVLEGRLPYAVPPPEGVVVQRRHVGIDGREVETSSDVLAREGMAAVGAFTSSETTGRPDLAELDDVESESDVSSDEEEPEQFNMFRALGIDAEGEAQVRIGPFPNPGTLFGPKSTTVCSYMLRTLRRTDTFLVQNRSTAPPISTPTKAWGGLK
jgi:ribosome biogenesis GTPase A|tara:strand:+ start:3007 stop:5574 length:2568 start_codon:yes stop_codon:yes gene_type:complete